MCYGYDGPSVLAVCLFVCFCVGLVCVIVRTSSACNVCALLVCLFVYLFVCLFFNVACLYNFVLFTCFRSCFFVYLFASQWFNLCQRTKATISAIGAKTCLLAFAFVSSLFVSCYCFVS